MDKREDSFRRLFNVIGELDSPQINAYSLINRDKPVAFSFRFKNTNYEDPIYLKISALVEGYKGKTKWIMHNKGSRKNYTIEPEANFKARCRLNEVKPDMGLVEFMGDKYLEEYNKAVEDIDALCLYIYNGLHSNIDS